MWAPKTSHVWISVLAFVGTTFGLAALGINPYSVLTAAIAGGIGGVLGALVSSIIEHAKPAAGRFVRVLPAIGAVLGLAASEGLPALLANWIDGEWLNQACFGGALGALLGLIPKTKLRDRDVSFANSSFWIVAAAGLIGGVVLALPAAMLTVFVGRRRPSPQP